MSLVINVFAERPRSATSAPRTAGLSTPTPSRRSAASPCASSARARRSSSRASSASPTVAGIGSRSASVRAPVARETAAQIAHRAAASGGDGRGRARRRHAADARARGARAHRGERGGRRGGGAHLCVARARARHADRSSATTSPARSPKTGNLIPVELIRRARSHARPGEAAAEFGELAGSAVDGAGDALGAMGDVLGAIDVVGAIAGAPHAGARAGAGGRGRRRTRRRDRGRGRRRGRRGRGRGRRRGRRDRGRGRRRGRRGRGRGGRRAGARLVDAGGAIVDGGAEGGDRLCACSQLGDVVSNIPWDDIGACFESVFGAIGSNPRRVRWGRIARGGGSGGRCTAEGAPRSSRRSARPGVLERRCAGTCGTSHAPPPIRRWVHSERRERVAQPAERRVHLLGGGGSCAGSSVASRKAATVLVASWPSLPDALAAWRSATYGPMYASPSWKRAETSIPGTSARARRIQPWSERYLADAALAARAHAAVVEQVADRDGRARVGRPAHTAAGALSTRASCPAGSACVSTQS